MCAPIAISVSRNGLPDVAPTSFVHAPNDLAESLRAIRDRSDSGYEVPEFGEVAWIGGENHHIALVRRNFDARDYRQCGPSRSVNDFGDPRHTVVVGHRHDVERVLKAPLDEALCVPVCLLTVVCRGVPMEVALAPNGEPPFSP